MSSESDANRLNLSDVGVDAVQPAQWRCGASLWMFPGIHANDISV